MFHSLEDSRSESNEKVPDLPNWQQVILSFGKPRKHSRLGMASCLIAGLMAAFAISVAGAIKVGLIHPLPHKIDLVACVLSGGIVMTCVNVACLAFCTTGFGLAAVGLVASRKRSHVFSWIGLIGNVVVVLGMLALDVVTATVR